MSPSAALPSTAVIDSGSRRTEALSTRRWEGTITASYVCAFRLPAEQGVRLHAERVVELEDHEGDIGDEPDGDEHLGR